MSAFDYSKWDNIEGGSSSNSEGEDDGSDIDDDNAWPNMLGQTGTLCSGVKRERETDEMRVNKLPLSLPLPPSPPPTRYYH
jgi:hypothetical protein